MRVALAGFDEGGIYAYNQELCRALVNCGDEVMYITPRPSDIDSMELSNKQAITLYTAAIADTLEGQVEAGRQMFDEIVRFDPDVLVCSDHIYLASMLPCFSDKRIRISISHYYNGTLPKVACCRHEETDWIVALSEPARQYAIKRLGCSEDQVKVVYNAVEDFNVNVPELISSKVSEGVVRIVFPGGRSWHKSPSVVFKLLKTLNKTDINWEFIWLGEASNYAERVPDEIKDKVLFTGRIPRSEAERYIHQAHCFVLPSRHEGCPMSMLEAMRAGVIPIVSNCPSAMRAIVKHVVWGYVVSRTNVKSMTEYIVNIAESKQLMTSLMKESRYVYEQKLTLEKWTHEMKELMSDKRSGRIKLSDTDKFDPSTLYRWSHTPGRWYKPTIKYLRYRFGYPDLSPIIKA